MAPKSISTDLPVHAFASATDFEAFLDREHETSSGIYVKFAKKTSGIPSITGPQAVEVALCFGWIDGRANGIDENWWTVRYTPRRSKSMWSQKNVNTYARLQEQGRLRPAGVAAADTAKADGRWERAYAGPATMTVPDDLATALLAEPTAKAFFDSLNKTDWYSVVWRVHTGSAQTRAKRIDALVQMLAAGVLPGTSSSLNGSQKKPKDTGKVTMKKASDSGLVKSGVRKPVAKRTTATKTILDRRQDINTDVVADSSAKDIRPRQPRRAGLRGKP